MTLHEAIIKVLETANRAMTTQQIANELNKNLIYQKKDGSDISAFQIHSRTRKYSDIFERDGNLVRLKGHKKTERIIIENFKVFKGQHVFDLKNLNVFTGANNNGKSTLMKAISLFSKSLENGDFPNINLFDDNAGEFENIVNRYSNTDSFKIGFFIELGKKRLPFKVLYEFVEYNDYDNKKNLGKGTAKFSNFEVLDINDNILFGVYDIYKFNITDLNIEYDKPKDKNDHNIFPFNSPSAGWEPGILMIKFQIDTLENYIGELTSKDFTKLIAQMKHIKGKHNNWWGEQFHEADYGHNLSVFSVEDIYDDIIQDEFCNIGDFETKKAIYRGEINSDVYWKDYIKLKEKIKYNDFIEEVIFPLIDAVKIGLGFFRGNNFTHITFQDFNNRLIKKNINNSYLFSLYQIQDDTFGELNEFVIKALKIFSIDGIIRFKIYQNSVMEIILYTGIKKINKSTKENNGKIIKAIQINSFELHDYSYETKQNLVDFGKGTANLIGLILKVYSVFHKVRNDRLNDKKGKGISKQEQSDLAQKFILVEEPEAFLHPDWQSKLADFFVLCLNYKKYGDVRFVVETHSEYLIRKLQYLTAKVDINPDQTIIYFFNALEAEKAEKNSIEKLYILNDGSLSGDFGAGFFDEATNIKFDLLRLKNPQKN